MIDLRTADLPDLPGAICAQVGPAFFFPDKGDGWAEAKKACISCPARAECLEYALEHHPEGMWAATTEGQRRRMREQRRAAA